MKNILYALLITTTCMGATVTPRRGDAFEAEVIEYVKGKVILVVNGEQKTYRIQDIDHIQFDAPKATSTESSHHGGLEGRIYNVCTRERVHSSKRKSNYDAQTFEYTYEVKGRCKLEFEKYFEFEDRKGNVTFLRSRSLYMGIRDYNGTSSSCLNIDAKENGLRNVKLKAHWIIMYGTDDSGTRHLITETHDGCDSLEELKGRNPPPKGV